MTDLTAISGVSMSVPAPAVGSEFNTKRAEFDSLVLEVLIKASGILNVMDESGGESSPIPISEMLAQPLARQLAEQVDLGFGSMLLRNSENGGG